MCVCVCVGGGVRVCGWVCAHAITYFLCLSLFDHEVVSSMAVDTVNVQCGC